MEPLHPGSPPTWLSRIRGAIGIGLAWAAAWFAAGMLLLLVVGFGAADVFAAGNTAERLVGDYGEVVYPANLINVITVGAIDRHGALADYTPRGPELDVVAIGQAGGAPKTASRFVTVNGCPPPQISCE